MKAADVYQNPWLDTLNPIQLPEPVAFWPVGIMWQWLVVIAIFWCISVLRKRINSWRANAYRREALKELTQLEKRIVSREFDEAAIRQLPVLVKRVCVCAGLPASDVIADKEIWKNSDASKNNRHSQYRMCEMLKRLAYAPPSQIVLMTNDDMAWLITAIRMWIIEHNTAPKNEHKRADSDV